LDNLINDFVNSDLYDQFIGKLKKKHTHTQQTHKYTNKQTEQTENKENVDVSAALKIIQSKTN